MVGLVSGSIGIISEAVHSGSDLAAALITFYSVRKAAKPADRDHRYGHEKVENVSGVIEALLIFGAALVIIYEAVQKLDPRPAPRPRLAGHRGHEPLRGGQPGRSTLVLMYPVARRTDSAALEADAAHHLTDVYTSAGVAVGLTLVKLTGIEHFDPIGAIVIAVLIIYTAYWLTVQSTRVLLDETLPEDELAIIRQCVNDHRGELITGYHKLRARRAGSRRHIDLHVTVDEHMTVGEAHDVAEHIMADIRGRIPNSDVLVHVEPRSHEREDDS